MQEFSLLEALSLSLSLFDFARKSLLKGFQRGIQKREHFLEPTVGALGIPRDSKKGIGILVIPRDFKKEIL